MPPISIFSNGIELSGAAITLIAMLTGTLVGAITVLWKTNNRITRSLLSAKDEHISAIENVVSLNTMAMKDLNGAVARLDEHLDSSTRNQVDGAQRSQREHEALLGAIGKSQEQAEQRHERLMGQIMTNSRKLDSK